MSHRACQTGTPCTSRRHNQPRHDADSAQLMHAPCLSLLNFESVMQDPVPRVGKFWVLFARPGQRVLVNQGGDMQVRPTPLDRLLTPLTPGQLLCPCPFPVHTKWFLPACLPACYLSVCHSVRPSFLPSDCLYVDPSVWLTVSACLSPQKAQYCWECLL